jgi:general secretion pathway protein G
MLRRWTREGALRRADGLTFVELIVVTTIVLVLASVVMPLAQVSVQRQRESDLRRHLREIRTAIDRFKDAVDLGRIATTAVAPGSEGYPKSLDMLVDGVAIANNPSGRRLKFLRRVPVDPMTNRAEWGLRAYSDKPDTRSWGGESVFDVYSKSEAKALDGTRYREW